ncbi:MAG: DUF6456 domain-containing protein [Methyloceanibacter sp.]
MSTKLRARSAGSRAERAGAERSHDWPQRAGKVVLQLGLTRLARDYGLDVPSDLPRRRKGIRHWGSEDYRPTLDSWRGSGDQ